jgi:hypothetical protein
VFAAIEVGMIASEVFEEREQSVGRPVAAGSPVEGCDAIEGALFDRRVGVQVDVRGAFLLVSKPQWTSPGSVDTGG